MGKSKRYISFDFSTFDPTTTKRTHVGAVLGGINNAMPELPESLSFRVQAPLPPTVARTAIIFFHAGGDVGCHQHGTMPGIVIYLELRSLSSSALSSYLLSSTFLFGRISFPFLKENGPSWMAGECKHSHCVFIVFILLRAVWVCVCSLSKPFRRCELSNDSHRGIHVGKRSWAI